MQTDPTRHEPRGVLWPRSDRGVVGVRNTLPMFHQLVEQDDIPRPAIGLDQPPHTPGDSGTFMRTVAGDVVTVAVDPGFVALVSRHVDLAKVCGWCWTTPFLMYRGTHGRTQRHTEPPLDLAGSHLAGTGPVHDRLGRGEDAVLIG